MTAATEPAAVDVVMPAYNAASTLPSAIASIQAQTMADFRLIIVDDGSTDETASILRRYAAEDPRILPIFQTNTGIVGALNAGCAHGGGAPLIARHDADDLSEPDRFARQTAYLRAHRDCVAVSARARHIDERGADLGTLTTLKRPEAADLDWAPVKEPYLLHPLLMMRREALRAVGGYRHLDGAEDSDLYWRLREIGRLHNLPDVLGSYRLHGASVSSASVRNGRLMAFCSQMAGISARRRRDGVPDVEIPPNQPKTLKRMVTLDELLATTAGHLRAEEVDRLEIAVAAKLLELCFYRPFEPEASDARFIRRALRNVSLLSAPNASMLRDHMAGTAVRLMTKGMFRQAGSLVPPRLYPMLLARLAFRIGLPSGARERLKAALGRSVTRA